MTTTLTSPPAAATLPKPNGDFYQLTESLNDGDRAVLQRVRAFMETSVAPVINKFWADAAFPFELLPGFRDLKIAGLGYNGYECAGGSTMLAGFSATESARVDCLFATFVGGRRGYAIGSIFLRGSGGRKQKWIPPMTR